MPNRPSLPVCSGRVAPKLCAGPMGRRHRALNGLKTDLGGDGSFDLDFRSIPGHGNYPECRTQASSFLPDKGRFRGEAPRLIREPQEQATRRGAFSFSPSAEASFGNSRLRRLA